MFTKITVTLTVFVIIMFGVGVTAGDYNSLSRMNAILLRRNERKLLRKQFLGSFLILGLLYS